MPYRRLPNSDPSRLRALTKAFHKVQTTSPGKRGVSEKTYQQLIKLYPNYEKAFRNRKKDCPRKDYIEFKDKARLYMSHYLKVMNMAIKRGELPADTRNYYGMSENSERLQHLNTEKEILAFGQELFDGDSKRVAEGGKYITNPNIGVVRVWYDKFKDRYESYMSRNHKKQGDPVMDSLRNYADNLILKIWNEAEAAFGHLPASQKRQCAEEYGVIYVLRKSEMEKGTENESASLFGDTINESESSDIEAVPANVEEMKLSSPPQKRVRHMQEKPSGSQTSFSFSVD